MRVIFCFLICILFPVKSWSKCDTLLMCPSFCMKVKRGCYVCDCGMFSNYLHRAAEYMASASNKQPSQTGTQLSSFTSGYGAAGNYRGAPNIQNGISVQDHANTMKYGFQSMNFQQYILRPSVSQLSAPEFTGYGLPGMNCVPVDKRCPSSCWSTDVYTGCIHCGCEYLDNALNNLPDYSSTESTIPSSAKPVNKNANETSEQLSTSNWSDSSTPKTTEFLVPTKPPKAYSEKYRTETNAPKQDSNRIHLVTTPRLNRANTTPGDFAFAVPTRKPASTFRDLLPRIFGYAIPTPLPTKNSSIFEKISYVVQTQSSEPNDNSTLNNTTSYTRTTTIPHTSTNTSVKLQLRGSSRKSLNSQTENGSEQNNQLSGYIKVGGASQPSITKGLKSNRRQQKLGDPFNHIYHYTSRDSSIRYSRFHENTTL